MSVRAQQLMPSALGEQRISAVEFSGVDPGALLWTTPPQGFNTVVEEDWQQRQQQHFMGGPAAIPQHPPAMAQAIPGLLGHVCHGLQTAVPLNNNIVVTVDYTANVVPNSAAPRPAAGNSSRKRHKEMGTEHRRTNTAAQVQFEPQLPAMDGLNVYPDLDTQSTQLVLAAAAPPPSSAALPFVSTGLRLAFDDDRSTVTSSRPCSTSGFRASSLLTSSDQFIAAQMSSYLEDLNQVLKTQADQLRQALLEKTQVQAQALMASVEAELSSRVREKEAEMERMSRRNRELEERVRHLSMEREVWQSKARSNEEMVAILRTNLQQVMVQVQQHQSNMAAAREGCGDSEVDDTASVYLDENPPAQQSRAAMEAAQQRNNHVMIMMNSSSVKSAAPQISRACRRCGKQEACVLLLPCLHVCLCMPCNTQLVGSPAMESRRCPVCSTLANNSAEVYLC